MCTNSHTFRWDTIAREWLERKQNLIRAEFAKAKVSVKEKSNESNGEKSIDPKNPFHGSRLSNNQNICYLNSTINALLSLRSFREFLMVSDPTGIVKAFRMVLNGSKTGDAETIRQLLQHKFTENFSFNYNEQVFAGDAINCVINYLELDRICNYSVTLRRKCLDCHHEFSEKTTGYLHFFEHESSTKKMISNKSEVEFENCPNCNEYVTCTEEVSISESNLFIMIGVTRQEGNNQRVHPTRRITSDGNNYIIKAVINYYPGATVDEGHYDTSIFINNEWKIVRDLPSQFNAKPEKMDTCPAGGLIFLYEREDILQNEQGKFRKLKPRDHIFIETLFVSKSESGIRNRL